MPALRWTPCGPSFRFFSRIFGGAEASSGVPIRTLGVPEHPQSDTNPHPWMRPRGGGRVAQPLGLKTLNFEASSVKLRDLKRF